MKEILSTIWNSIKEHKIQAFNYSKSRDDSVCFNLLEIPGEDAIVVTVSILKNRKKTASLDYISFAKLMTELERRLMELDYNNSYPYFSSLFGSVSNSWYATLNCHRIFIIPTNRMFDVLNMLTSDSFRIDVEHSCGIRESSIYVTTKTHNLKIVTFNKEE